MRYYGYIEWLGTVSGVTGIDIETLRMSHVDALSAIIALSAGGGCRVSSDDRTDTADGCFRLLVNLCQLRPYRGNGGDRVTYASIRTYARKRGFELDLGRQAVHLIEEFQAERLEARDVINAIRGGLTERAEWSADVGPRAFHGLTVTVAHPVTDPDSEYVYAIDEIQRQVVAWLGRSGARVLVPDPANRTTSSGRRETLPQHRGNAKAPSSSSRELLTRSLTRITSAHLLVIISEVRSVGIHVEREWALRLGIPIVEFELSPAKHPHQDGPELVTSIPTSSDAPEVAVREFQRIAPELLWQVLDAKAIAEAERVKNEAVIAHLRASWNSLRSPARKAVARTLRMSRPYIEGLLSNGSALELASDRQRGGLERMLGVHSAKNLAPAGYLDDAEVARLTAAAERAGLTGLRLVQVVRTGGDIWRRSRMRVRLASDPDAERCVRDALNVIGRAWPDDDR